MNKHYSTDSEIFNHDSEYQAILSILESDGSVNIGDEIVIFAGDQKEIPVTRFTPDYVDFIAERASDDYFDLYDQYPNVTKEEGKEIQKAVDDFITNLFKARGIKPNFYDIVNVKEIKVKITNVDKCEFEILGDDNEERN